MAAEPEEQRYEVTVKRVTKDDDERGFVSAKAIGAVAALVLVVFLARSCGLG
ncbi:hypothetical protein ACFQ7F_41830 [Streptomyces sp. NPDC056486]|uniref:hypothetical protein n=1 Tax=Streptomyces sp. NPDC056486 TaxID=3345835 RepID=UPI0036A5E415